jgi:predicted KAP-like P-loop ATPase
MALLQIVADKIYEKTKNKKTLMNKTLEFIKRIKVLRTIRFLAPVALGAITGGTIGGTLGTFIGSVKELLAAKKIPTETEWTKLTTLYDTNAHELNELLKSSEEKSIPKEISEIRKLFQELLQKLKTTLVVLVDDLDRCLPDTAISTLEAMRLLLFTPGTVFIIAADEQMIRNAVRSHFNTDLSDELVTSYFDKLIQIPIQVPRLSANEVKGYLILLFADWAVRKGEITEEQKNEAQRKILDALKKVWKNRLTKQVIQEALGQDAASKLSKEIDIADQLANIMVTTDKIAGNPRLIKRFLNSLYLRQTIAKSQEISIGFEEMIKYQLFERCATQSEFEFLVKDVAISSDGKSRKLCEIEEKIKKGEECSCEEWKSSFMKQWLELSPCLGEMDIRPLVYLSRDRSTPHVAYDELSPEGKNIFEALCNADGIVEELYDKIKSVGKEDAEKMLTRFRRDARNRQWNDIILKQALNIPKAIPNLADNFVELLNEIPAPNRSVSFIVFIREESWAHDLCQKWANDPETPKEVKNAINFNKRSQS